LIWVWLGAGFLVLLAVVYFVGVRPVGRRDTAERDGATMVLREEQLQIRKTRERLADVTTRREISREIKTVTVPVTKEELVVERNGVEAVRIPIREERVDVATRMVPLHEVSVHQREWTEDRKIQAVLKKEVARIETTGDVRFAEATTTDQGEQPHG